MDIKERPILDLSLKRFIFNRRPTNKDIHMDVNGKKIMEAQGIEF